MLHNLLTFKFLVLFFLIGSTPTPDTTNDGDLICGKWISAEKTTIVQVYKDGNTYKGKMVWFKNQDTSKAMEEWTDKHNPDESLRSRKLIGMEILRGMRYDAKSNSWEKGKIYEAQAGREWNAAAVIENGLLKVTGYWKFKFIGKTMTFTRVN